MGLKMTNLAFNFRSLKRHLARKKDLKFRLARVNSGMAIMVSIARGTLSDLFIIFSWKLAVSV